MNYRPDICFFLFLTHVSTTESTTSNESPTPNACIACAPAPLATLTRCCGLLRPQQSQQRKQLNYSFIVASLLHLAAMFSMPAGAMLAPECTVELLELDAAFARALIMGMGVRDNAFAIGSVAGLG